jgi:hypothetical protein
MTQTVRMVVWDKWNKNHPKKQEFFVEKVERIVGKIQSIWTDGEYIEIHLYANIDMFDLELFGKQHNDETDTVNVYVEQNWK